MIARSRKRQLATFGLVAAIAGAGFAAGYAYAAQPHMQAALGYLQNAKGELEAAEANKGGHRATAIRLINQAIGEVQAGMAAAM
jgi:hypothetical protein